VRRVEVEPAFPSWRDAARRLLAEGVPPDQIRWVDASAPEQNLLPGLSPVAEESTAEGRGGFRVPRRFVELARAVACHRAEDRWEVLYRVLWRLAHGEPGLLEDEVDDDVRRLILMEKAVRRDSHKMKAFVRFRRVEDEDGELYVAWHRPDHRIVERVAPFFVERFGVQRWSILTPDASAHWDGDELRIGPGLPRTAAPEGDELEDLWRTYYASIFNPARIMLKAMRAEMPVRHWATLPETRLIPDLLQAAPSRVEEMIEAAQRPQARDFFPAEPEPSLPSFAAATQSCRACPLFEQATQAVFGEGPARARLMLIGEQPGDQEDLDGRPFVGPAGQVLDEVLAEVGIAREEVYLTNAVKHFKWEPRGKRRLHQTPTLGEAAACRPWLESEIALVKPERIVCLGATAARALLGAQFRITRQRGEVFEGTSWAPWVMATYHPSALLRMPDEALQAEARRQFVEDLRKAGSLAATDPA
jgi:probable DNA metabolism protein